ncbi:undecaprenyl-phosphate glucose phosphotransferase [Candidatus Sumerlaeota bacterium]|nr:undecaprenyl-phosphate glucose phosphotransferase [Candidatus Sumerlaeota bacterium]
MLRRHTGKSFTALLIALDSLAAALGLLFTYWFRFIIKFLPVTKGYDASQYLRIFPVAVLVWIISLNFVHVYVPRKRIFSFDVAWRLVKGSFLATVIMIGVNFLLREAEYSRPVVVVAPFAVSFFLCVFRYVFYEFMIHYSLKKGKGLSPVFIVGTGQTALILARRILNHPEYGYSIAGYLTENPDEVGQKLEGVEVVGIVKNLKNHAQKMKVREIMLVRPDLKTDHLFDLMIDCERELITVHIVPDFLEIITSEISVNEVGGVPLFGLKETPLHGFNLIVKRLFDILVSLAALILFSPVMAIVALLIWLDSKGPIIYRQERMGVNGHTFTFFKFRSMAVDAEKNGPVWARQNDPRCTRIGARLRSWNLDELPQFWNVLKGDMSLVGPRPERPVFVEKFKNGIPRYMARHRVKSGITGWAQVNGLRGDCSITERLKYDLYYIENWSLLFDVKILILTLFAFH